MLGIIKVYINNSIFYSQKFCEEEINIIKKKYKEEVITESINFDMLTFDDFNDSLEFADYDKLLIICNKSDNRFKGLINGVRECIDLDITVISNDERLFSGFKFQFESVNDYKERLEGSNFAINSGFYPYNETIHIKHIVTDKLDSYFKLNKTVYLNTSINSLVLYKENSSSSNSIKSNYFYPIFLSFSEFEKSIRYKKFHKMSIENIENEIKNYQDKGIIDDKKLVISDFGRYRNSKKIFSLFIKNEKIYYDLQNKILLSEDLSTNIFEITNRLKQIEFLNEFSDDLITEYFISNGIAMNQEGEVQFISPFTSYHHPCLTKPISTGYEGWIGFITNNGYFMFNKEKNKLFEVNKEFIDIFELLAKDLSDKYDNKTLLKEAEGMLSNV
ncbi:hypothetical protein ETH98_08555 [Macrococcoides caseolyticum]|uniref:hypothetical protein n=1 Tax=Macrococcoides caseolyticum TaxID=69966 RepID=UPI00105ED07B|nr:hypothetical protein [Macrococcus caseolyticus]TDM28773.1 hypothetical protein ETH98_08555 [Macrococcus caseolyticus]VUC64609.1 Uncharacterised protein [Macrococcus caseolyticus]